MAAWSEVEHGFGAILGLILGSDRRGAMTLYLALTGSASKTAALRAIARDRMSEGRWAELEELLKAAKGSAGERNDLAHGIWGYDTGYPDHLVLMPPNEMTRWTGGLLKPLKPGDPSPGPELLLYSEKDFLDTGERIAAVKNRQILLAANILSDRT